VLALLLGFLFLPTPGSFVTGLPDPFPFNSPAWSLFWEVVVNALYGAIAKWLTTRVLFAVLCAGFVAVALSVWWYGYFGAGPFTYDFWGGGARAAFSFFAGVALWRLQNAGAISAIRIPAIALMAALLLVLAVELSGTARVVFDVGAVVFVFPLLIYFGALSTPRAFAGRICNVAGRASYGVYVLQFPFIELLKLSYAKATHGHLSDLGSLGVFAVCTLTVGAALVLDAFYDTPLRKHLLRRFWRRRNPVAA